MVRNLSLVTLSEELRLLAIASENKEGVIKKEEIMNNAIDFRTQESLIRMGYLKPVEGEELPYCNCNITEKGRVYAKNAEYLLNNLSIK